MYFGTGPVKGFAVTLSIGIVASMLVALTFTRYMLVLSANVTKTKIIWGIRGINVQVIKRRKWFYILSLIVIIPGIISLMLQGLNLGIDFTGGSITHVKMPSEVTSADMRATISELGLEKAEVQKSGDEFYLRTSQLTQEQTDELMQALRNEYQEVEFMVESVGATIGEANP